MTGSLEIEVGLAALAAARRDRWARLVREAEESQPRDFDRNGWVVHALQGAWSSIHHAGVAVLETGAPRATALRDGLERAVRGGRDTDTVAAIAGGMLGAVHGASATPAAWRRLIHGWPGLDTRGLTELAVRAVRGTEPGAGEWPLGERMDYDGWGARAMLTAHPHDEGVLLGSIVDLDTVLDGSAGVQVDAVVSLCRVGRAQRAATHIEQWLIDDPEDGLNPNLNHVLADTVDVIAQLRGEGKTVLVHCVQAQSHTPSVAALYAVRQYGVGVDEAFEAVRRVLPGGAATKVPR
ncbi:ADP-ribosylation/Crystallin J1 [Microcella alkaliphila]|uniref:ADP-ribosylation/Crystallin J1 n=1 Tax=Microcella alkaliphila TaxID=279828 RepID=A0A0U4WY26_9MICO|nr:ADP-ribosylglycohydrolase family protein [Microcella alkaliphila]BAU32600.1 ADP-ribosylation/Crystallin J1 [Microcella alkaliphila]